MKAILHPSVFKFSILMLILAPVALIVQAQAVHHIAVTDFSFSPDQLEVHSGDTVIWTNTQGSHNVNGTQTTFASNPESFGNTVSTNWTYTFVFNTPGTYNYQCDPHAGMGMDGQITVSEVSVTDADITINFSAMNPHIGQDLWLALIDQESGEEIKRVHDTVTESFSVVLSDIATGRSYNIDFFVDHNQNGYYNPPPDDHAWRLEIPGLAKDTTLAFVHNTTFTDIEWEHRLKIQFTNMNPHIGQLFMLYIFDSTNDVYLDTISVNPISGADFDVESESFVAGNSYNIDFFADLNGNGTYDAPPVDHAWRIVLEDLSGDTTIVWIHNTDFTNIFEIPTGRDPGKILDNLQVFPNPARDHVTLSGSDLPAGELQLRIFNNTGQLVKSFNLSNTSGRLKLNINDLNEGIYHLLLENNSYRWYSKLVISE